MPDVVPGFTSLDEHVTHGIVCDVTRQTKPLSWEGKTIDRHANALKPKKEVLRGAPVGPRFSIDASHAHRII